MHLEVERRQKHKEFGQSVLSLRQVDNMCDA